MNTMLAGDSYIHTLFKLNAVVPILFPGEQVGGGGSKHVSNYDIIIPNKQ